MYQAHSVAQLSVTPFLLNKRLIDAKRGTIELGEVRQAVEPKVMQVLLVLAANAGNVVDQETLFAQVWPNSIFSSGSIRRCIAILRKQLGDEDSDEEVITTHPKKGYSLNSPIALQEQGRRPILKGVAALAIAALTAVLFIFVNTETSQEFDIAEAYPVTASEHQEFNAILSPDGSKVGFMRTQATERKEQALWFKDLATEQEFEVVAGNIREYAWSPSGSKIAYVTRQNDLDVINQVSVGRDRENRYIASFSNQRRASSLHWGSDGRLYSLVKQNAVLQLIAVETESGAMETVKSFTSSFRPYRISVPATDVHFAVAGFDENGLTRIKTLRPGDEELTDVATLDENMYFLSWHPDRDSLLISDGRGLSSLDLSGNVTRINYENFDFIQRPQFTPDGEGIILSQGKLDMDIVLGAADGDAPFTYLIDTNTVDRAAVLSPDNTKLAFISHRKGFPQVYILELATNRTRLVYENKQRLLGISTPVWHPSGEQLGFSNYEFPVIVTLSDDAYSIETFTNPAGIIVDWYGLENALLTVSYNRNTVQKVNLDSQQESLLGALDGLKPVLDENDRMLFAHGSKLIRYDHNVNTNLVDLNERILAILKHNNELQITTENGNARQLVVFDMTSLQVTARYTLPERVGPVLAFFNGKLIYETTQKQKDIVYLKRL